ncbi:MAG: hypothetical protein RI907_3964 [Pseudomonadota bacterium]|jgi:hypothetical protein
MPQRKLKMPHRHVPQSSALLPRLPQVWRHATFAAALFAMGEQAAAQSYTARVLANPSATTGCQGALSHLDEQGNVVGVCWFKQTNLSVILAAWAIGGTANDVSRTVLWRGTSNPVTLASALAKGFAPEGRVVLAGRPASATATAQVYSLWNGNSRTVVTSLPGLASNQMLSNFQSQSRVLSRNGRHMLLHTATNGSAPRQLTLVRDGVVQALPPLPDACYADFNNNGSDTLLAVSDAGHAGVLAVRKPTNTVDFSGEVNHQPCLWNGQSWVTGPALPAIPFAQEDNGSYEMAYRQQQKMAISAQGDVLLHSQTDTAYLWQAGTNSMVPAEGRARDFAADGQLLGGAVPSGIDNTEKALAWRQGAAVDLNTVTSGLPTTLTLISAVSANAKGQILAVALNKTGNIVREKVRLVLLTPR